jgi:malonyl CoA-acyl carrier protein transacylase
MRAFFFPGQMSEHRAMWTLLEDRVAGAGAWLRRAETASGLDLSAWGADGPFDDLTAQVMVLAANAAWSHHLAGNGLAPDAVVGHSLGCYSALEAAGVIDFEFAVALAVRVQRLAEVELAGFGGAMGVLIGHGAKRVAAACADAGAGRAVVANINTAKQVVISGRADAVDAVLARLADGAMRAERLYTAIPFHSPWMRPVTDRLLAEVDPERFADPEPALFSHLDGTRVESGAAARELICTQIARTLDWPRALNGLWDHGCRRFVETGPGDVLTRMTRWVLRDAVVAPVEQDYETLLT